MFTHTGLFSVSENVICPGLFTVCSEICLHVQICLHYVQENVYIGTIVYSMCVCVRERVFHIFIHCYSLCLRVCASLFTERHTCYVYRNLFLLCVCVVFWSSVLMCVSISYLYI